MPISFTEDGRRGRSPLLGTAIGLLILAGCGETTVNAPLPAAKLAAVATIAPRGSAGQALADLIEIRAVGSDDQPLPRAKVTFSAANGGSVNPTTATTDDNGIARTRWTLGPTAGPNTLTATAESGVSTTITATATAGRPATVAVVAGDNQTATAGAAVPTAPSVRVADAFGNLVANTTVTFSVLAGAGSVTGGIRPTDAQGIATVGSWILGNGAGIQTLAARVEENGVTNNPVIFTATATPRSGSQIVATAGNNQRAPVGRLVAIAPTVVVSDPSGGKVPGVVVTFAVATGGGSVVGSRQTTDATGTATVGGWFLGPLPGPNTLTASAPGLPAVTFTATADAGLPVSMAAVSATSQTAAAGAPVADAPSVVVRDVSGAPVSGVVVTFAVTAGGGSVAGSPATTNANGTATLTSWRLGPLAGPNSVTASSPGLTAVTFNATAGAGAPATVAVSAGNNQAAVQGTAVAVNPAVKVTDASGNPVAAVVVTFAVTGGAGSATGLNQVTDALGVATVGGWTLGSGAPNALRATVTGTNITGNPVNFTAQSATRIAFVSLVPNPPILGSNFDVNVQLQNSANTSVALSGVSLTIAMTSGTGTLSGVLTTTTGATGAATFTAVKVTGTATASARTFTISGVGLASATISITF